MTSEHTLEKSPYLRWWIWLVYSALLAAGIPWYWPADSTALWLGMPAWVTVAVADSIVMSAFTVWLLLTRWPDLDEEAKPDASVEGGDR